MKLHYFNPENDLALAAHSQYYTAPANARRMHDAGALLPLWYADPGDKVLCHGVNAKWLSEIRQAFGIEADIYDHTYTVGLVPSPWGWSACTKRDFIRQGIPEQALPTDEQIEKMRDLSHRRTAALIASKLKTAIPDLKFPQPAIEVFTEAEAAEAIGMLDAAVVKAPWSSSGRGVANSAFCGMEKAVVTATDAIRRQGSAMIEPALDKAVDFAKIYVCQAGKCEFHSTSVFTTDDRGTYLGNLLASENVRNAEIAKSYDANDLDRVTEMLRLLIEQEIAPYYDGIVGVDMLVCKDGTLDPVVEINLRKTMGYAANEFATRYLAPGVQGRFISVPTAAAQQAIPATIENFRLVGGAIVLTPENRHFTFMAIV